MPRGRKWGFRSVSKSTRNLHILIEEASGALLTFEGRLKTVLLTWKWRACLTQVAQRIFRVSELAGRGGTPEFAFLRLFQEMLLLLPSAGTWRVIALNCSLAGIRWWNLFKTICWALTMLSFKNWTDVTVYLKRCQGVVSVSHVPLLRSASLFPFSLVELMQVHTWFI